MQFVSEHKTDKFPIVTAIDNTARVQIVTNGDRYFTVLREVLEILYRKTGCPVLLNTSLNIKDEPIIDNIGNYKEFIKWSGLNDLS